MPTYQIRGTLLIGAFDPFDDEVEPETRAINQRIRAKNPDEALATLARRTAWREHPDLVQWLTPPQIDQVGG